MMMQEKWPAGLLSFFITLVLLLCGCQEPSRVVSDEALDQRTTPLEAPPTTEGLPVFPWAQGFGIHTPGGRGGKILKVTNLNDSGPGSLRAAVEAPGPRIVVFEISGLISLESELAVTNPFITIAGQTAPPPGITLRNRRLRIGTHDVVIQHLRSRPGDAPGAAEEVDDRDALTIQDFENDIYNVVVDHCSFSWAVDEVVGIWGYRDKRLSDITISNSIISEGLNESIHPQGAHSKGLLVGDYARNVSLIGNLIASNVDRNGPLFKGGTSGVVVNNLVYNSGRSYRLALADDYDAGAIKVSAVGNLWHDGPGLPTESPVWLNPNVKAGTRIYLSDNMTLRKNDSVADVPLVQRNVNWGDPTVPSPPLWVKELKVRPVEQVERHVLRKAGARPAERSTPLADPVDLRLVEMIGKRKGAIYDSVEQAGGWPRIPVNRRGFDIPEDPHREAGSGYTGIEEILHRMASDVQ